MSEEEEIFISLNEVTDATLDLIEALAVAQNRWARSRNVTHALTERMAVFAAYSAIAKAFRLDKLDLPTETHLAINRIIAGIELTTGQVTPVEKAQA